MVRDDCLATATYPYYKGVILDHHHDGSNGDKDDSKDGFPLRRITGTSLPIGSRMSICPHTCSAMEGSVKKVFKEKWKKIGNKIILRYLIWVYIADTKTVQIFGPLVWMIKLKFWPQFQKIIIENDRIQKQNENLA